MVTTQRLTLDADTAADLMSDNPISLAKDAGIREAIALMTDRGYAAAPVIDESGRPVGVISVSDILIHDREFVSFLQTSDATVPSDLRTHSHLPDDMGIEVVDPATVADVMTPTVFTIHRDAPATEVVQSMLAYQVHHLFVADDDGTLVGVISMGDVLRHLR